MKQDHHSAAMSALAEIQGVLHRHSMRKPDTTPDMTQPPTEGSEADNEEDKIIDVSGELTNSGESGTAQDAHVAMDSAERAEDRIGAQEPKDPEPMRILSYGGRSSSVHDDSGDDSMSSGAPSMPQKRGRGRPRKY